MIARSIVGTVAIAVLLGLAAGDARAGCTVSTEATAVKRSLARQVRCNDKKFRQGPGATCLLSDPPACAGTLVTDAVALGYGPNEPPAAAVDTRALRAQLSCQKRIGAAISAYVGGKLSGLIRGMDPATVDARARRMLDRLPMQCLVTVVEDAATQIPVPAVGRQCAAAAPMVGSTVDGPAGGRACAA